MKVLVTGGTGFVGSAVVRSLLRDGYEVRALVRAASDRRNLDGLDIEVATGDLGNPSSLARACAGCGGLFHVAADYRLWARDAGAMISTNVDGTRNLLRAAAVAGVGRIVYTSSVATLGINADGTPADEDTPSGLADMIGPYKRSKFLAEQTVREMIAADGLNVVIVNPAAPVGPRDIKPTPTGRMVVEAAAGRVPAYVDTGLNIVHVDDVADGHVAAFEKGEVGERYILGGENLSLREILAMIAGLTGGRAPRFRIPHNAVLPVAVVAEAWTRLRRRGEPFVTVDGVRMAKKRMYYSSTKAVYALDYTPRPAIEALADAVDWFRDNGYLG